MHKIKELLHHHSSSSGEKHVELPPREPRTGTNSLSNSSETNTIKKTESSSIERHVDNIRKEEDGKDKGKETVDSSSHKDLKKSGGEHKLRDSKDKQLKKSGSEHKLRDSKDKDLTAKKKKELKKSGSEHKLRDSKDKELKKSKDKDLKKSGGEHKLRDSKEKEKDLKKSGGEHKLRDSKDKELKKSKDKDLKKSDGELKLKDVEEKKLKKDIASEGGQGYEEVSALPLPLDSDAKQQSFKKERRSSVELEPLSLTSFQPATVEEAPHLGHHGEPESPCPLHLPNEIAQFERTVTGKAHPTQQAYQNFSGSADLIQQVYGDPAISRAIAERRDSGYDSGAESLAEMARRREEGIDASRRDSAFDLTHAAPGLAKLHKVVLSRDKELELEREREARERLLEEDSDFFASSPILESDETIVTERRKRETVSPPRGVEIEAKEKISKLPIEEVRGSQIEDMERRKLKQETGAGAAVELSDSDLKKDLNVNLKEEAKLAQGQSSSSELRKSGEHKKLKKSGEHKKLKKSGEHKKLKKSGEHKDLKLSSEHKELRKSGEHKKLKKSGEHKKLKKSGEHKELRLSGEYRLSGEIKEHKVIDEGVIARERIGEGKVVKESIKEVELHKVQPVIHREREQKEIRHVVAPKQEFEVKDTVVHHREREIDLGTRREASTLETSRSLDIDLPESTREFVGKDRQHQELPMQVEESVHRKVEEHIHPVVYKEVLKPKVTEEVHHVYEKVKEAPIETYEIRDVRHHGRGDMETAERAFFSEYRGDSHGDHVHLSRSREFVQGSDVCTHHHQHIHQEPLIGHHQNIGAHHLAAGAVPEGHNTAYDAALCQSCTASSGVQQHQHSERDVEMMRKAEDKKLAREEKLRQKEISKNMKMEMPLDEGERSKHKGVNVV